MKIKTLISEHRRSIQHGVRHLGWSVNRLFRKQLIVATRQGKFLISLQDEIVGKQLFVSHSFELDLMTHALNFLREIRRIPPRGQGTLVDIGANIGVISIGMLHAGEMAKAIAIEPEPFNFRCLLHNVALNGLQDRMICLPYAASDKKGELLFELSPTNYGNHRVHTGLHNTVDRFFESQRHLITVQADLLDNLLAGLPDQFTRDVALIWVDVQGYEGFVFRGAQTLLSRSVPVVAELWPYGMLRCGMAMEEFSEIARQYWTTYWVYRRWKWIGYPIDHLDLYFEELGDKGSFGNVIFTS